MEQFQLSPQQRLRWQSGLPAASLILDLHGAVDLSELHGRLQALVARHEVLRLRLCPSPGLRVPLQRIVSPSEAVHAETGVHLQCQVLGSGHQRLHLQLPALSADRGTLLRLARALAGEAQADDEDMSYTQYSAWLYELQDEEDAELGRRYWREQALGEYEAGELPYRQARLHATAGHLIAQLDASPELTARLETFCRQHQVTPAEVLLTAWCALLQRLSPGETPALTMNWVHDCRDDYDELAGCWGAFAKSLPLAWRFPAQSRFSEALDGVQRLCDRAREWQEYCDITSDPSPDASRYGFEWGGLLPQALPVAGMPGTTLSVVELNSAAQAFDLLLTPEAFSDAQGAIAYRFNLAFASSGYNLQSARVLLEQYRSLLLAALDDPEQQLQALALHSPSFDTTLAAVQSQRSERPDTAFMAFPLRFSQQASRFAERLALCDARQQLTYAQLEARSNQLARFLNARGIGAEDRVALHLERNADAIVAMLGVLKIGAAFLPLDNQQPLARSQAILAAARPAFLLVDGSAPAPTQAGLESLDLDDLPCWQHLPDSPLELPIAAHSAAYVLHTSGSTGTPKGVVIEHRQLGSYVDSLLRRLALAPGERSALVTSLAADLSYTLLFPALLSGGELHVVDKATSLDAATWAAYQARHPIDHLKTVPSLLDAWLAHSAAAATLPRRQLILGGEHSPQRLLQSLRRLAPELTVYNHYGPTETTIGVLMHRLDPSIDYHHLPLDDRLDGMRTYLLDEQGNQAAPGQAAELYLAGPQLARGYLDEQQTRERFGDHPQLPGERLYRTGDRARYRPDGSLEIIGRVDRQVKIRGFRVELDDIEAQLARLPGVAQAAVTCVASGPFDQQLFAFLTLEHGQASTLAQLQRQAQERLPEHMRPALRLVDALPLLGNGKLDRKTLAQWAEQTLDQVGDSLPRTPLEQLLADIWAGVLGLERVGIEDDFFALGGHSLAAVKLASRLQNALGTTVPVNAVFDAPSVARFAELVQAQMQLSPLVPLSRADGAKGNLFCFHPSTGHVQDYRVLSDLLGDWNLWGLQATYLAEGSPQPGRDTLEALAAVYVEQLRRQQPQGPYHLLGWSLGGLLAFCAAAQLEQAGEEVAFLGIVDSQTQRSTATQRLEALLQSAAEQLDADSQQRLSTQAEAARAHLLEHRPEQWPLALAQWARQQGLHLAGDSWEQLEYRLRQHAHTQTLIGTFRPATLRCPLHLWWASATLQAEDFNAPDWRSLSQGPSREQTIAAQHLDILRQDAWQRALVESLANLGTPRREPLNHEMT
ncbi:amino acid adenylation domain-containing protein [Ectopseudomonas toyotomiensis]|uniref:Amino acid adenylation domain-containing protein n=1 Tax=Ectopseudomonas toyotomiensis TaxID=554344 RepID=A0ABD7DWZ3_9GAMM|nr:non-ribosomal peptide synthetase [Pseudomonas toyotomiensis]QSL93033.1 amino acid adenylation domain-containing protein [Pseudomonas toyotomiensis]